MISVLVADDHPVVRDGLCTMLELEADIKVVGRAADGAEAVEQARRTHPDVILMDVQMPELDGLEATRRIKARGHGRAPRIVAMTANAMAEDRAACMAAGMDDYITKPIPVDLLAEALVRSSEAVGGEGAGAAEATGAPTHG